MSEDIVFSYEIRCWTCHCIKTWIFTLYNSKNATISGLLFHSPSSSIVSIYLSNSSGKWTLNLSELCKMQSHTLSLTSLKYVGEPNQPALWVRNKQLPSGFCSTISNLSVSAVIMELWISSISDPLFIS